MTPTRGTPGAAGKGGSGQFTEERLDALREVANIGAGHGATALSMLVGSRIMISVTRATVLETKGGNMPEACLAAENLVCVRMDMHGSITGRTALILPENDAARLAERMLGRERGSIADLGEMECSALNEAGNIIGGAYLTALSEFLGMRLMPSPPSLSSGSRNVVASSVFEPRNAFADRIICCETEFTMEQPTERLHGFFVLVPDASAFEAIFSAVRLG